MKVAIKDIKGKAQGEFDVNFAMIEDGSGTQAVISVPAAEENTFEEVFIVAPPLVAGTNVFAVSVHQKGTTSSDLSFDLAVQGIGPSAIPVGSGDTQRPSDSK